MSQMNNIKFLSLPQQVEENRKNIQKLLTEYSQVFTTQLAIQGQSSLLIANLTNIEHKPVVGDLIYGSDSYYAQITRVGESVVEFIVIGQIADLQDLYDYIDSSFDNITANIAFKNQSNVFTQPQQVPNATLPQHATNKLQVETMFEMFKRELRGYNLGGPNLTGKTEVSAGVYRIFSSGATYLDYNVYSGLYNVYTPQGDGLAYRWTLPEGTYTITVESDNTNQTFWLRANGTAFYVNHISGGQKRSFTFNDVTTVDIMRYTIDATTSFILQIEKGSTATPYTVPGQIPAYKIVGEA